MKLAKMERALARMGGIRMRFQEFARKRSTSVHRAPPGVTPTHYVLTHSSTTPVNANTITETFLLWKMGLRKMLKLTKNNFNELENFFYVLKRTFLYL